MEKNLEPHYKQELSRSLKLFGSFAAAFSAISITTGISLNLGGEVLARAGTLGLWTWPMVAIGQLVVALIFAELSGVIPLSGYSYQWVKRLANPGLGWFTGWVSFCFLFIVVPSIDLAIAPYVCALLGFENTQTNSTIIVIVVLSLQAIINAMSIALAEKINTTAVYTEVAGVIGLTVALLAMAFARGAPVSNLFDSGPIRELSGTDFLLPFAMTALMGFYTNVGFEVSANLSEETRDAPRIVPRAVILSIAFSGIFGTLLLIALAWATPSLTDLYAIVAQGEAPIAYIISSNLGRGMAVVFMVLMVISIFACGLIVSTSASRMVYALARDDVFFASNTFKKVNAGSKTPVNAIVLLWVLGCLAIVFANSITILAVACAALPGTYYLITVASYLRVRRRVVIPAGRFNLGKWGTPLCIVAIVWLVFEIAILTLPAQFHKATVVNLAIWGLGAVLYFSIFRKRVQAHAERFGKSSLEGLFKTGPDSGVAPAPQAGAAAAGAAKAG